jgi:phosphoribosylanthranilate isomerase
VVEIKFCGMTRAEDARHAANLGARYVGVIFAGGPRGLTPDAARRVLASVPDTVGRVGVFGTLSADEIASRADWLDLDVVQLHGDPDADLIEELRGEWDGEVWAVQRVEGTTLPDEAQELFDTADGVVLDARVAGKLGGTGVSLPWHALRDSVDAYRGQRARVILAGGLRPENVAAAIEALHPDVVDVSSGVEAGVGVKDHARMRAFRDAVHSLQPR